MSYPLIKTPGPKGISLRPGHWWYCPWYIDSLPSNLPPSRLKELAPYLSIYYFEDWFPNRAPVCIVCPGQGSHWVMDSKATNAPGWKVTGSEGRWTAAGSILVPGYHGYLKNGILSDPV